jgi:ATP-dependent RNA helicase DDX47/RRP3
LTFVTQYDVELYQRVEKFLGKQLEAFTADEAAALLLAERVTEAQRLAALQMREADARRQHGAKRPAGADGDSLMLAANPKKKEKAARQ